MKYEIIVKGLDYNVADEIASIIRSYSCCIEMQIRMEE